MHGLRVRYITSALLLTKLAASLADQTLPQKIRELANYDLLADLLADAIRPDDGFGPPPQTNSPERQERQPI